MLFKAADDGRALRRRGAAGVMLRLLTGIPPGKVRFTIIDPVGLGQNFAAFMHLADYDEALVTSRIWTEPQHIEQRLADLTEHMENVIQKYLRNEFATIEEYNAQAGEVAEPFRVPGRRQLPGQLQPRRPRARLVSIAGSGPRCGVLHADHRRHQAAAAARASTLDDLEQHGVNLVWRDGRFAWKDPEFEKFCRCAGRAAGAGGLHRRRARRRRDRPRTASRVEVPFEFIAPPPEQCWTGDSRGGIDVPLGRAGATKLQHLRLGKGTSQHVLIAGKTGSGKSTLLHALITNLALHYSPDEVELYLIDFKKGVEFKTYATHELPHARVVAIESEREFGLSVLQRLDAELKERGELFRQHGVQDLAGYRDADGAAAAPHPADRRRVPGVLRRGRQARAGGGAAARPPGAAGPGVRHPRALGSQTLGGAYSLARSTLDQMAVRIALQCSEADAHLILSEDNSAARLLSRPGEAIYNDANGLVEGNDSSRSSGCPTSGARSTCRSSGSWPRSGGFVPPQPQLVFEGNIPADIAKNRTAGRAAGGRPPGPTRRGTRPAWLGDAIAIKDPTAAVFRRQSGSNLLIVGQNDEAALGA